MAAAKNTTKKNLIPISTEEITIDWFEKILNIKVDPESFSTTGNVSVGVGFLSNLVRVQFKEISPDGQSKEHRLVVKLLPFDESMRQLVIAEKMDKTEIDFYKNLMPEILKENPSLAPYFCPFTFGDIQNEDLEKKIPYASVLVLRDLKADGYILKPFNTEVLTPKEIELTTDFLANFHAASTLMELKKQVSLSKIYDFPEWYYPNESKDRQIPYHTYFIEGMLTSAKVVISEYTTDTMPSERLAGEEIISTLIEPFAPFAQKILNAVLGAGQLFPSLVHGDLWQNNLLISQKTPQSVKIIDWQMVGYSDSIYDVAMFLVTSLHPNLNLKTLENRAKIYFDRLEKIYSQKEKEGVDFSGCRRRSWEVFWQTVKTYGTAFVFIISVMHCAAIAGAPENYPKIYEVLRFYHYEVGLATFLKKIIE